EDRGGWPSRDTAKAFGDYASVLARRLGDRVKHWITHNEPGCTSVLGHVTGEHAPGKQDPSLVLPVTHHLLLSHGLAVQAIRAESPQPAEVGITLNLSVVEPATDRDDDIVAAQVFEGAWQDIFLEPLYNKRYPESILNALQMLGASTDAIL